MEGWEMVGPASVGSNVPFLQAFGREGLAWRVAHSLQNVAVADAAARQQTSALVRQVRHGEPF
jgi:hypothetical protein